MSRIFMMLLLLLILPFCLNAQQGQSDSGKNLNLQSFSRYVQVEGEYVRRWGFASQKGKIIIKPQFSRVKEFSSGLAPVARIISDSGSKSGKPELWGYINTKGEIVIPFKFTHAEPFDGNHAFVKKSEENYLVIDRRGTIIKELQHSTHEKIDSTIYRVFTDYYPLEKRKVGLMDNSFNYIVEPKYNWVKPFSEGLAAVSVDWEWGYIDRDENFVIAPAYIAASNFNNGRALVTDKFGIDSLILINKKGESVGLLDKLINDYREQRIETYNDSLFFSCLDIERDILNECTQKMFGEPKFYFELIYLSTPKHTKSGGSTNFHIYSSGIVLEEGYGYESFHQSLKLPNFDYTIALRFFDKLARKKNLNKRAQPDLTIKYFGEYSHYGVKKLEENLISIYFSWSL